MSRDLTGHPIKEPHPWGEHRSWCSNCGAAAWCDDVAFHVWHVGAPFTAAGVHCERPRRTALARFFAWVSEQ